MAHADVPEWVRPDTGDSVRGGIRADATEEAVNRSIPGWDQLNTNHGGIFAGCSGNTNNPAYDKILQSEAMLKKLVPILIVVLLVVGAIARWATISAQSDEILANAKSELHFIAELVQQNAENYVKSPDSLNDKTINGLQIMLSDIIPAKYLHKGRMALLTDTNNRIVASVPYKPSYQGEDIGSVIGDAALMLTFGKKVESMSVETTNEGKALAVHRLLPAPLGGITIIQPEEPLFATWRHSVSLNVSWFVATSIILLVILYCYFALAARAKAAEEVNSANQNRFDTALNRARCGLWDWNLASGNIYWSNSMYEILGLEPCEDMITFQAVKGMVNPEDINLYEVANQVLEKKQESSDQLFRMRHSQGHWVWIRNRWEIIYTDDNEPKLIGIVLDVSEQEKLKEESRVKDMRLNDAIESLSEAFVLWDKDMRLLICNSKYMQFHTLDPRKIKPQMHYNEVMSYSERPLSTVSMFHTDSENSDEKIKEARLEDGRWLQINERPTRDGGYVSVGTDITALKRQEAKLKESEKRLKKSVDDLTRSKHESEIQAQRLSEMAMNWAREKSNAEKASRIKSEFLANISHEWRTPLNAIIGFSEMMLNDTLGPLGNSKYREYARDIKDSGDYLLGVINDILDMSKIEAGRLELNYETFRINEIVEETIRITSYMAEARKIDIKHSVLPNIELEADRRSIKQILINLLSNAVKFSHEGGTIKVRAKIIQDCLQLSIRDQGIGISEMNLKRLGKPFEQVQNQFTKNHKGSGLGLAISRSLVEAHGGSMKIISRQNRGTIVSLRIPLKQTNSYAQAAE